MNDRFGDAALPQWDGPEMAAVGRERSTGHKLPSKINIERFVCAFMRENAVGQPMFKATRRLNDEYQIAQVGEKLRGMMTCVFVGIVIDRSRN